MSDDKSQPGGIPLQGYPPPMQQQPYDPPQTVTVQPQPGAWMIAPSGIPNCPAGLEYLTAIDQLLVHQKVELFEGLYHIVLCELKMLTFFHFLIAFVGFETANKYTIKNSMGQMVYFAAEGTIIITNHVAIYG